MAAGEEGSRTLTLLFTDIEGSTRALQQVGDAAYARLLDIHLGLLRERFAARGGVDTRSEGDALFFVFESASAALQAAVEAQRALDGYDWPEGADLRARIGVHSGEVLVFGNDYRGLAVHQAARVCSAGHGGQVIASSSTVSLAERGLDDEIEMRELGYFRLKDLSEPVQLFQVQARGAGTDFARLRTLDASAHNLPVQPTPLIGRVRELAEIHELVMSDDVRLLTLTGPGGIGKTRLAVQLAAETAYAFEDGVWFVDLAPLRDAAHVATTIVTSLGAEEDPGRGHLELLKVHLAGRRALLILDNFEQLISAADVVSELLNACPRSKIVITSRSLLRLRGERGYVVPSLGVTPGAESDASVASEATDLFVQGALAVDPSFVLNDESLEAVRAICERLDGLPLAIELAASRTKLLSPVALLERLGSRLDVLESDRLDAPERQRTMHSTIAWSYELLNDHEKRTLRRLSIFRGGSSLDAAEAVGGSIDDIASLVDRSLVRRTTFPGGGVRFGLLDTIAEFASDELDASGERDDARRAHAEWYAAHAVRTAEGLRGPDQASWLDDTERDVDNLRAVIEWSEEPQGSPQLALRLVVHIERFWRIRGYSDEIAPVLERLLAAVTDPSEDRARGLLVSGNMVVQRRAAGELLFRTEEAAVAHPLFNEAVAIARQRGDNRLLAEALMHETQAARRLKGAKQKEVEPRLREALAIAKELGDEGLELEIRALTPTKGIKGIFDISQLTGTSLSEERLASARARGDRAAIAEVQMRRAGRWPSDPDGSKRRAAEESLELAREIGDRRLEAEVRLTLGTLAKQRADFAAAADHLFAARDYFTGAGDASGLKRAFDRLSELADSVGDRDGSRRLKEAGLEASPSYRAGAFLRKLLVATGFRSGPGAILSALCWTVVPLAMTWGGTAALLLAVTGWSLSGDMRTAIQWFRNRRGAGGSIAYFPFTLLTLLCFLLAYAVRRPDLGAVVVSAVAMWRLLRKSAAHRGTVRRACVVSGVATMALGAVSAVQDGPLLSGSTIALFTCFVALYGLGAQAGPSLWRVAQIGWYLVRFAWPVLAIAGLAESRGVDMGAWLPWAGWATAAGTVLFAFALLVDGGVARVTALLIAAGAIVLALAINGRPELAGVGGLLFGGGWLLLVLIPVVFPPDPIFRVIPPEERNTEAVASS